MNLRRSTITLLMMILITALLTACTGANPQTPGAAAQQTAYPVEPMQQSQPTAGYAAPSGTAPMCGVQAGCAIQLTDGLDRSVSLPAAAKRVVSMAPSNTEILFAVGAGSQVVGRDEFSDFPEAALPLPSVGGSMGKYNFEQIAALQPDLVLASELNTPAQVKSIEDLGLTVYYLKNPVDLEGMFANLNIVGQLTGHEADAETLVAGLRQRVSAAQERASLAANRPTVYYELDATDPAKPFTAGANTFISQLIQLAGGVNIGDSLSGSYAQISSEALVAQSPQIILLGDAAYGTTPEQVSARPGWNAIQAVKDNKIFAFDDDLASRPGPRLVDGLEALVKILHP